MKYSKQRQIILQYIQSSIEHPSADMIYVAVSKQLPHISLGTIYRNLNVLVESGQIRKIKMPDESDRYDKTIEDHYHFSCTKCHQMYDIDNEKMKHLSSMVEQKTGHQVLYHDIVFVGICKNCL